MTGGWPVWHCGTHGAEGPEGGSRKPQACQPDLSAREGYETDHLNHTEDAGQPGFRPSQHGFMKGRFCLTNLIYCEQ